eukprot:SAG22_NODE_61_length_23387_cov_34.380582_7_plen_57_part_00
MKERHRITATAKDSEYKGQASPHQRLCVRFEVWKFLPERARLLVPCNPLFSSSSIQ